jgi:iron complex outermembrane receptor protein
MTRVAIALLIGLIPSIAAAQDPVVPVVERVTVTGHAEDVPFRSLARDVVVLTRDDIARLPVRSIADVLAMAGGVDVRSRGAWGVQTDFSLRGGTFDQTLVLVDGVRLNDSQSGHHNGDIPVPLEEIDRIEVLLGPGSSLYGADAFGGTINVITRHDGSYRTGSLSGGSDGYVSGSGALAGSRRGVRESVAFSTDRSAGFEVDREFRTVDVSSQTRFANGVRVWVSFLGKSFGANGFYGPAQSTEQTNQTLVSADGALPGIAGWSGQWQTAYRTHGDTFTYDRFNPGTPNQHRDHAVEATGHLARDLTTSSRLTVGTDVGADWIRSNNLGAHSLARASGFVELQQGVAGRATVYAGLRGDEYSTFGAAWNPSLAIAAWLGPHAKVHASTGHAFRVPTFTDRFYSDPANVGNAALTPERAWGSDAGIDLIAPHGGTVGVTAFDRHDRDTIDFVRASVADRWQAQNIRAVAADGVEVSGRAPAGRHASVSASYTFIDARTDTLPLLSHYALDVARHALELSATARGAGLDLGGRAGHAQLQDGRDYWVADARVARRFARATVFVDGTNLFNEQYQEVLGVDMPGRAFRAGVTVGK